MELNELFGLAGKTALITGGGRGIGRMMAEGFIRAGASKVYIASRNQTVLEQAAAELSDDGRCIPIAADLSTHDGIAKLVSELSAREEKLDILINNSGAAWGAPMTDFPEKAWDKVFQLNLKAPFYLTAGLLPLLEKSGTADDPARIINIGSIAGEVSNSLGAYPYGLSKGAIHQLTKMMAKEFASRHITANAIAPGRFPSKMTKNITSDEEAFKKEVATIPLGRFGRDSDIAGTALFLAARSGAFITGAVIPVDGGSLND
ncbi:MAG: 3-oxoacyl-ACP reductase [Robiginitomaculum sp.]|nr:MAG: 3-oxoacyl-ACP reductase [Robiginitomaculum sp.]